MAHALIHSPTVHPSACRADFLNRLFAELDARGIKYCVLHSFENLPEHLPSDLDMAISSGEFQRLPDVLAALEAYGYRAVQCLNYAVRGYYLVFSWTSGTTVCTIAIDFISEHREGNLILTSGDELVRERRRFRDFWIPSAAAEFRYLLSKKVLKGVLNTQPARRLTELAAELGPEEARTVCARLFGKRWGARAAEASATGTLGQILGELKRRLWMRVLTREPWMPFWYRITDLPRLAGRMRRPTGFLVAVLGPDGVGKSTLIAKLGEQLDGAFRSREVFHWRPKLLFPDKSGPVLNPHARANFSVPRSLAHLAGHFADYQIGFALRIRPLLARTGLVIFDRYFYDLAADPKRYRYGGPPGIPKMLFHAVPRPDVVLVLDAPENVLLGRKNETTAEEIRLVRERYWSLAEQDLPVRRLDASREPDAVALEACCVVLDALRSRFTARHGNWVAPSRMTVLDQAAAILGAKSNGTGERQFAVLPNTGDPRWLVPISGNPKNRLSVYAPYAYKARAMKIALSAAMRLPASTWARETISIPAGGQLEDLVRQVLGVTAPDFTISLGTPSRYRKATIQIGVNGRVTGFVKIPLTVEAKRRVKHEAAILSKLSKAPHLNGMLPELLYAGEWGESFILLQSPLGGKAGRTRLGTKHRMFLEELANIESQPRQARVLLAEIDGKWGSVAGLLNAHDRRTMTRTLRAIEKACSGLILQCGYSHGDFAPWNTRDRVESLGVFDWEAADFAKPREWDAFHFQTQTAALLGRDAGYRIDMKAPETSCSYLMYLAHSTCLLLAEQGAGGRDVNYRIRRLKECLE